MAKPGLYRGVAEFFDRTSASITLYDNNNTRYYVARVPISDFRKAKIQAREGVVLETELDKKGIIRLIKEIPLGHVSPEELKREDARLDRAFKGI